MIEKQIEVAKLIIEYNGDCSKANVCKNHHTECPLDATIGCDPDTNKKLFNVPLRTSVYDELYMAGKVKWFKKWLEENEKEQLEFDFT